jgi:RNA polymerase-binding transcription factor DksA
MTKEHAQESALDTAYFREKLLKLQKRLETELAQVARRNPQQEGDWETVTPDMNVQESDPSERSDRAEEFENISGTEAALEEELTKVNAALERIAKGTYGVCKNGGEGMTRERLEANPAAETCIAHDA